MKTILFVLALLGDLVLIAATLAILPLSVMMFDAGETPQMWVLFYSMWAIPLLGLGGVIGGLIVRFALRNVNLALWLAAAPLIYTLLFSVAVMVAAAIG